MLNQKSIKSVSITKRPFLAFIGMLTIALLACSGSATSEPLPLPNFTINDVSDNGRTNVAYFIVADVSLTRQEAEEIINVYKEKHIDGMGYLLINIYIFCDATYADYEHLNEMELAGGLGDAEYFEHLLYWYQTGEMSSEGLLFISGPTVDFPTFGNACK